MDINQAGIVCIVVKMGHVYYYVAIFKVKNITSIKSVEQHLSIFTKSARLTVSEFCYCKDGASVMARPYAES